MTAETGRTGASGTGGRLRDVPDDFHVEEIPAYEPSGAGTHLHLRIEKRGIPTMEAAARVAKALGVRPRDVGWAGLKDARAVTVQTLSVEHVSAARAAEALADVPGVRLLDARLHGNKLRLGHLRGNRFTIRIRDVLPGAAARARSILDDLVLHGSPHWFGEQRFGSRADNDAVGRHVVRGEWDLACDRLVGPGDVEDGDARVAEARRLYAAGKLAESLDAFPPRHDAERRAVRALLRGGTKREAVLSLDRRLLRLLVSAYQSALFNRLLAERRDALGTLETGDLAFLHDRGAVFLVEDAAKEQPRADALEISPSGPLFGTKSHLASGEPGRRERALLDSEGLAPASFRVEGVGDLEGERRPYRVPVTDVRVEDAPAGEGDAGPSLLVAFALPRGAFATSVLAEVMRTAPRGSPASPPTTAAPPARRT
jgi:tRNA pseudouridine13 synthase